MSRFTSIFKWLSALAALVYIVVCSYFYLEQEKLIFPLHKLPADYSFVFQDKFEERRIKTSDGKLIDGLLFKSDSSKGLIFYLHGNAGSLETWGLIASTYTKLHYDLFIPDYRGYGKSEGEISSEQQFFDDMQTIYDSMKKEYDEKKIVILGYSIGTGPAAMLAAHNHPKMLILQAPYFSVADLSRRNYPFLPPFLLKYKFRTNEFVSKTKAPVVIIHGDADEVIYCGSSLKLKECFKPGDKLVILKGQGHNGFTHNDAYVSELKSIL